jgi:hypothetical protein
MMIVPDAMLIILAVRLKVRRRGALPRLANVRGAGHDGMHGHSEALCLV